MLNNKIVYLFSFFNNLKFVFKFIFFINPSTKYNLHLFSTFLVDDYFNTIKINGLFDYINLKTDYF